MASAGDLPTSEGGGRCPAKLSQRVTYVAGTRTSCPWEIRHIDELDGDLAAKPLIEDPDTGMSVMKMKYFAGFTNEWHTHTCACAIR